MLTDVNSGTVFAFLALSAPFLGISLYDLEHVSATSIFDFQCISDEKLNLFLFQSDAAAIGPGVSMENIASIIFAVVVVSCGLVWPFLIWYVVFG